MSERLYFTGITSSRKSVCLEIQSRGFNSQPELEALELYVKSCVVFTKFSTPFLIQIRDLSDKMHDRSNQIGTKSNQFRTTSKQFRTKSIQIGQNNFVQSQYKLVQSHYNCVQSQINFVRRQNISDVSKKHF